MEYPLSLSRAEQLEMISTEVSRVTSGLFHNLRFPRWLETAFEAATRPARCRRFWFEGLLAIILFDAYILGDCRWNRYANWHDASFHLLLITPLALIVNAMMRFNPGLFLREASVALVTCTAGAVELLQETGRGAVRSAYAQFAVTAVLVFSNAVMRLRFMYALAASLTIFAFDVFFLTHDRFLSQDQKWVGLFITACTLILSMQANYSQHREERLNFLLSRRDDLMLEGTRELNSRLELAAGTDALTGVANRVAFNWFMDALWESSRLRPRHLSVIIVDIDHFKGLNDTFGHIYGDQVLKSVAHTLSSCVRSKDDFLARFGGEEFVMYLPDTSVDTALAIAERLRRMVEQTRLPAPPAHLCTLQKTATISCGVASALTSDLPDPETLLDAADRALYRAKAQGRNLVRGGQYSHFTELKGTPFSLAAEP